MKGSDVMSAVVADMITRIEAGAVSWTMPWHHTGEGYLPINVITRNPYRGGNVMLLLMMGDSYSSNEWGTYKQWNELGAQVNKGEKGTHCIFWKLIEPKSDTEATRMFPNSFVVFNAEQVEGYMPPPTGEHMTNYERADFFTAIPFKERAGNPAYSQTNDVVYMPASHAFVSEPAYQATLAHELTHWTGHKSRLDRLSIARFGSNEYAAEELVAELGAAFLCAHLGIATEQRQDHAAYLSSWLAGLKAEPKMLWTVASKAQAALDHLISYQPTESPCPLDPIKSLELYGEPTFAA